MDGNVMTIQGFLLIYLLLVVVILIMKRSKINKERLLFVASLRMSLQLVAVGFVLQYLIANPLPIYTILFLLAMIVFSIQRIFKLRPDLNSQFRLAVVCSFTVPGLLILIYFICVVVGAGFFNPQYTIPIAGMILGNSMTGISLGLKSFIEALKQDRKKILALQNLGVDVKTILVPYVNNALETAILPTINSMLGMGIIFLPGMMTGQIISGTVPTTAILYQIAILIAICAGVCITVFFSLTFGYKTLYNSKQQFTSVIN